MSQEDKDGLRPYIPVCVMGGAEANVKIDANNIVVLTTHHAQTAELTPVVVCTNTGELESFIEALQHLLEHAKEHDERPKSVLNTDLAAMLNLKNIH